ncbi:unnamed protein product [Orchesella dallaii]|uniref:Cns1/TTC4 wheel domain-containing protein n=1 Tax=Orchesella dallaii TaxID=48710 RepID=A0ABP1QTZ2_9HEXA
MAKDRIDEIVNYLQDDSQAELPDSLKTFKYADGWDPDKLEEELQSHPFFMTKFPEPGEPVPPLLEAFQQLKYSENDNTPHELALNHKEDGMFHFKLKKYRIACSCFTTAITMEVKSEEVDKTLLSQLFNNRAACMFFIQNYRSCVQDCERALQYDPAYLKAIRRAISACEKLGRFDDVEKFCEVLENVANGDEGAIKFVCEKRIAARKGKSAGGADRRKELVLEKRKKMEIERILKEVEERGIRIASTAFVESDAANEGKIVKVTELNGQKILHWPVLLMYPQYSQSDFIEEFCEATSFSDHLYEMLDRDPPAWDQEKEYRVDNIEIYYIHQGFVKVDMNSSLGEALKSEKYILPSNGVPSFFVLAKDNRFCEMFKERVDIEK